MTTKNQLNSETNSNKKQSIYTKMPPDGGWGWIIVIGYSLFNVRKPYHLLFMLT